MCLLYSICYLKRKKWSANTPVTLCGGMRSEIDYACQKGTKIFNLEGEYRDAEASIYWHEL